MYDYAMPNPLVIELIGKEGFELRVKASEFVESIKVRGMEAGNEAEQTYGVLAEMTILNKLGLLEPD